MSPKWSITRAREVLDHHVGVGDQTGEQPTAFVGPQIQSDRTLVGVHGVEHPAVLPPVVDILAHAARVPDAVGTLDRLHLDDVGAERREQMSRGRPGPERGQVDDANALERQPRLRFGRTSCSRLGPRPGVVGLAERGRPAQRCGPARATSAMGCAAGESRPGCARTPRVRSRRPYRGPSSRYPTPRSAAGTAARARRLPRRCVRPARAGSGPG